MTEVLMGLVGLAFSAHLDKKILGILGVRRNDTPPLTFVIDPTMNLISEPHHECKRSEHNSPCFGST